MGKKGDLSYFECGIVVSWTGLSVIGTVDLLGFTQITICLGLGKYGLKKKEKSYIVSTNSKDLCSLLMSEVRRELADLIQT